MRSLIQRARVSFCRSDGDNTFEQISASRRLCIGPLAILLLAGCGGHSRKLGDGQWYGKVVSVDVARRRLKFAPTCNLAAGRWVAVSNRVAMTIPLARHPDLTIYFRPNGSASAGHAQSVGLHRLADVVAHGRLPDFPPGWFVTTRGGAAASIAEDSGLRSSGSADKRTFACVWSKQAEAFVSS